MSLWLQVSVFLASIAIVLLVAFLLTAFIQLRRQAERMSSSLTGLQAEVRELVRGVTELVERINNLSGSVQEQWQGVAGVVQTVRDWTGRADHIVREVDAAIEPPIISAARAVSYLRVGVGTFFQALLHRPAEGRIANRAEGR